MTLSTDLYILDPVDPREVFDYARSLLGERPDGMPYTFEDRAGYDYEDGERSIAGRPGQNMPAWLMVHYNPDGPLFTAAESMICTADCEPEDSYHHHYRESWVTVNWDTAYSYSDDQGRDCTTLHAHYIITMGEWLTARGLRFRWENEYTGEVHDGSDWRALAAFVGNGDQAQAWFTSVAVPAINHMLGGAK